MSKAILFLLIFSPLGLNARDDVEQDPLVHNVEEAARNDDLIGMRALAFRTQKKPLSFHQWERIRDIIHHHPAVGWDLIRLWDKMPIAGSKKSPLDQKIDRADDLMSEERFKESIPLYRTALREMKPPTLKFGDPNYFLYQSTLHSLARAEYGAGLYQEALRIYRQISLIYPMPRQIQFEKMWTALRAKHFAVAMGAIVSQKSSYFSKYLEPEAYLVQYYLYRRLCREDDVKLVLRDINDFKNMLEKGTFTLEEWAGRDFHTRLLLSLSLNRKRLVNSPVTAQERKAERTRIRSRLEKSYKRDLVRLRSEMEKVVAYLNLAPDATQKDLPKILEIPGLNKILNSHNEMWPMSDAEDWLDEVGQHVFIGRSECK